MRRRDHRDRRMAPVISILLYGLEDRGIALRHEIMIQMRQIQLDVIVSGGALDAPRELTGDGCVADEVLTDTEKAALVRWIDLGATYLGTTAP